MILFSQVSFPVRLGSRVEVVLSILLKHLPSIHLLARHLKRVLTKNSVWILLELLLRSVHGLTICHLHLLLHHHHLLHHLSILVVLSHAVSVSSVLLCCCSLLLLEGKLLLHLSHLVLLNDETNLCVSNFAELIKLLCITSVSEHFGICYHT